MLFLHVTLHDFRFYLYGKMNHGEVLTWILSCGTSCSDKDVVPGGNQSALFTVYVSRSHLSPSTRTPTVPLGDSGKQKFTLPLSHRSDRPWSPIGLWSLMIVSIRLYLHDPNLSSANYRFGYLVAVDSQLSLSLSF